MLGSNNSTKFLELLFFLFQKWRTSLTLVLEYYESRMLWIDVIGSIKNLNTDITADESIEMVHSFSIKIVLKKSFYESLLKMLVNKKYKSWPAIVGYSEPSQVAFEKHHVLHSFVPIQTPTWLQGSSRGGVPPKEPIHTKQIRTLFHHRMSVGTEWGGALGQAEGPASKQAGWVPIEAYSMELGPVPRFIHPSSNRGSHLAIWGCTTLECDWLRRVSSIQPQYTTIFKILQDIQLGRTHYGQSSKMLTGFLHQRFTTWTTQLLPIMVWIAHRMKPYYRPEYTQVYVITLLPFQQ